MRGTIHDIALVVISRSCHEPFHWGFHESSQRFEPLKGTSTGYSFESPIPRDRSISANLKNEAPAPERARFSERDPLNTDQQIRQELQNRRECEPRLPQISGRQSLDNKEIRKYEIRKYELRESESQKYESRKRKPGEACPDQPELGSSRSGAIFEETNLGQSQPVKPPGQP